jgi:hypothetical protein
MEKSVMRISCHNFDELLLEGDTVGAAEHAKECPACREKLASWNEISAVARGMHTNWTNEMLWPRIARAIRNEKRQGLRIWQVAAGFLLLLGIGLFAWRANENVRRDKFNQTILQASAVDEVEKAEKAHVAAIDQLEKVTQMKLDEASTPLLVSYKEKLMLLDDAIAECQSNIDRNRQNAHLRKQLLAIYSEKQRTLQQVLREGNHVSNQ